MAIYTYEVIQNESSRINQGDQFLSFSVVFLLFIAPKGVSNPVEQIF